MFYGKWDVGRVTLDEFNISYILMQDSHSHHITMDKLLATAGCNYKGLSSFPRMA